MLIFICDFQHEKWCFQQFSGCRQWGRGEWFLLINYNLFSTNNCYVFDKYTTRVEISASVIWKWEKYIARNLVIKHVCHFDFEDIELVVKMFFDWNYFLLDGAVVFDSIRFDSNDLGNMILLRSIILVVRNDEVDTVVARTHNNHIYIFESLIFRLI